MRFLLVPENNALSHIGKSLALEAALRAKGHEVFIAVSAKRAGYVRHLGERCCVLPDIQEMDQAGYPTVSWFWGVPELRQCIRAECDLIQELRPDRVLGVFRFTLKASAQLAGVPFDSFACGCMLPESPEVLGFADGEPELEHQRKALDLFYRFSAARMSEAMGAFGLEPVRDIRMMLKGDRTFLWDFPEFSPLPELPRVVHVGPIPWEGWPHDALDMDRLLANPRPLAILTFGTCVGVADVILRLTRILRDEGFHVLVAAGGQEDLLAGLAGEPDVTACRFAPLQFLFPHTALLVCHGGQLTVFEALAHGVPVLVMPFQAEQAHNGVCLERIGCGRRLIPPQPFRGHSSVFVEAMRRMNDGDLAAVIRDLMENSRLKENLARARNLLSRYHAIDAVTSMLEEG